jgi:hypothetical protein
MEIFRLVKALEELIFEVSFWFLSYPKSLLKVIVQPGWVPRYVKKELAKEEQERFDEYMSPALFYALSIVIAVVPRFEDISGFFESRESMPLLRLIVRSPEMLAATTAVVLVVCPLAFAWVVSAVSKLEISRSSFRLSLLSQFLIAGPFILVMSYSFGFDHGQSPRIIGIVALIWFCVAELLFFKNLLGASKIKAALLVLAGFGAWYIVNLIWLVLLGLSLFTTVHV